MFVLIREYIKVPSLEDCLPTAGDSLPGHTSGKTAGIYIQVTKPGMGKIQSLPDNPGDVYREQNNAKRHENNTNFGYFSYGTLLPYSIYREPSALFADVWCNLRTEINLDLLPKIGNFVKIINGYEKHINITRRLF